MQGIVKVVVNIILQQKSNNLHLATQHSPVANFLATNEKMLMHKQHILQLFNFFNCNLYFRVAFQNCKSLEVFKTLVKRIYKNIFSLVSLTVA